MDGTVNWANREEGRPAFAGWVAVGAAGTEVIFSTGGEGTTAGLVLVVTGIGMGLAGTLAPLESLGLAAAMGAAFLTGSANLLAGLLAFVGSGFKAGLPVGLGAGFSTFLAALTALAAGFPDDLAAAGALLGAGGALLSFPGFAFTSCLLAEGFCAWSMVPAVPPRLLEVVAGGVSPARECTGFPIGKPISCKIETIIWLSI
jgi:hypothetical protein